MDKREMRSEIMNMMIREMSVELKARPWHIMSRIRAPVTDAHVQRANTILDELWQRYCS